MGEKTANLLSLFLNYANVINNYRVECLKYWFQGGWNICNYRRGNACQLIVSCSSNHAPYKMRPLMLKSFTSWASLTAKEPDPSAGGNHLTRQVLSSLFKLACWSQTRHQSIPLRSCNNGVFVQDCSKDIDIERGRILILRGNLFAGNTWNVNKITS